MLKGGHYFMKKLKKFNFEVCIIYDGNGDGRNRVPR